jgi:hypothetical protein
MQKIQLSQGKVALVDDSDYPTLSQSKWHAAKMSKQARTYYACRSIREKGKQRTVRMHCEIMGAKGIDHADENGLNNQRYNLRPANCSQQTTNRSKQFSAKPISQYKGIGKNKNGKPWRACIKVYGEPLKHLGFFTTEVEAAKAYDAAAVYYFGEFAKLNFPLDTPQPNSIHLHE